MKFSDKAPGLAECDVAIDVLNNHIRVLDSAYMDVVSQTLDAKRGSSLQAYNQQVARSAAEIQDTIDSIKNAAKYEAEHIGHTVNQMVN